MRQIRNVLRLVLRDNVSRRTAALSLSVPRSSVNDLVTRALAAGVTWEVANGLDDTELEARLFRPLAKEPIRPQPDFNYVKRELAKKGVTLNLLWLEYLEQHPGGYAYSQFCALYRAWRKHLGVTMRQDHKAGEKLFVDFPGLTIPIYDPATLQVAFEAELFVTVLGASSYLYVEALRSQELLHWVNAHCHAFSFYDGCPEVLVPDNLRSAVSKSHRYEPDPNATYQEMAEHYGCVVIPARPYKPRDKACASDCSSWVGSIVNSSWPTWHHIRCDERTDSWRVVMLRDCCNSMMRTHVSGCDMPPGHSAGCTTSCLVEAWALPAPDSRTTGRTVASWTVARRAAGPCRCRRKRQCGQSAPRPSPWRGGPRAARRSQPA